MNFQTFDPHASLASLEQRDPGRWQQLRAVYAAADVPTLRRDNGHWFGQPTGMVEMLATVWVINLEFTRRGIGPAWRGGPRFVDVKSPPPNSANHSGPRPLGDTARRSLLRRWIDLEWLRAELGSKHAPLAGRWADAFSDDDEAAFQAFRKVNAVVSKGGGKVGPLTPFKTLHLLDLPALHRLALTGLINRDAGEAATNARKRVQGRYRARVEALMSRESHPLTRDEVERRLLFCEAIELARGRPTDAALVFRWMTGERVTRQSMHEMRMKLADQCHLTGRAWRAPQ